HARGAGPTPDASRPSVTLFRIFDDDPVLAVVYPVPDGDAVAAGGRQVLADVVGADRQLPMAAVDEDGQLDHLRPTEVDQRVEGRADRPAREENVVDQHDGPALDGERDVGALDPRLVGLEAKIVTVERDVERSDRDLGAVDRSDPVG